MGRAGRMTGRLAFGIAVVLAAFGSLFVAGYAFEDPDKWAAVGQVASYLVPMLVLAVVVRLWPSLSVRVMAAALALLAGSWLWYVIDVEAWTSLMDHVGPILGVAMLVLILPLGMLGLRRPLAAGLMLASTAVLSYAAFLASIRNEPWFGLGDSLSTSRTILCGPMLVIGLLFLLAALFGQLGRRPHEVPGPPAPQPPAAVAPAAGVRA